MVKLSSSTLDRHAKGGRSQRQAHEEQRWLNDSEVKLVIQDIIAYGERSFSLSHRRIKELAKREKRRPGWKKPMWRKDFRPETIPERPKRVEGCESESEGGEDDDQTSDDD